MLLKCEIVCSEKIKVYILRVSSFERRYSIAFSVLYELKEIFHQIVFRTMNKVGNGWIK